MKAYTQDLREHVLRAVDDGYPRAEIVQIFGISLSTLKRYVKQRREQGKQKEREREYSYQSVTEPATTRHYRGKMPARCDAFLAVAGSLILP
jgi:transposase